MTEQERNELTPQDYIRKMFEETKGNKLVVECKDEYGFGKTEEMVYELNWTKEDAEKIIQQYNLLTSALARMAPIHEQLKNEKNRQKLLTQQDLQIWETYVKDYEPFDVDFAIVDDIMMRAVGDLCEEEEEISDIGGNCQVQLLWKVTS